MCRRGMQALARARELGGAGGFYALQSAIVACHSEALTEGDTDWSRIAGLYAQLAALAPSPIQEARAAFAAAAALAGNEREYNLLKRRASEAADAQTDSRGLSFQGDL